MRQLDHAARGTKGTPLSRRGLLKAGAATALPWPLATLAQDSGAIRIGQSTALTGPLGELGQAMHEGAQLCFSAVNARGGVLGRPIELDTRDDGYDARRAVANVTEFLADRRNFALFNCMGTPMIEAVLPQVIDSGIPFFAPFTGAVLPPMKSARNVFALRASYADEAEKLVQHLATIGIKRLAIAYQNNAFGQDVFASAKGAMDRHQMASPVTVTVESSGADAAAAAAQLVAAAPDAVLIGLAGKPALEFAKAMRAQRRGLPLFALSVMGTAATLKALGSDAAGISFSQVVPMVGNLAVPVVRDFLQAWKASGSAQEPSHLALEGYINARVFAEALTRAGRNPTRAAFIDATWKMRRFDVGGFEVSFTEPGRSASRFVELAMAGKDGRFIR